MPLACIFGHTDPLFEIGLFQLHLTKIFLLLRNLFNFIQVPPWIISIWPLNSNGIYIFSDPRVKDSFTYVKKPKIWKLQGAQKCLPLDGSSSFDGTIRFWAFGLVKLAGKAIFIMFHVAPPIKKILFKISC